MATSFEPIKFANLTEKTTAPSDTDIIVIEDSTATKKAKWSNLISWIKSKLNIGSADISGIGDGTITGAVSALNTKIDNKYVYYRSLADIGITDTASVTWDNIVSALPERSGIKMAGWKPSAPGLTSPAAGPAIVITVDKYLSGYVTLQVWDIATNTVYCTTHNGVNYSAWKTLQ
nr:MAG TPA: hypothetical protein [Caudoviricetes sp.]